MSLILLINLLLNLLLGIGEWACTPIFEIQLVASQPLVTVSVGKGYIVSRIGCDFHVAVQGWFD